MLLISRRLATGLLLVPIGGVRFAGAAPDATARITFVLVNDIYLMADELMPDGQRRGGFARLAAVVKAERAKASVTSGHVIFAHGGDTLSPSLMSGIDHGKHIMTLTNPISSYRATTNSISARQPSCSGWPKPSSRFMPEDELNKGLDAPIGNNRGRA